MSVSEPGTSMAVVTSENSVNQSTCAVYRKVGSSLYSLYSFLYYNIMTLKRNEGIIGGYMLTKTLVVFYMWSPDIFILSFYQNLFSGIAYILLCQIKHYHTIYFRNPISTWSPNCPRARRRLHLTDLGGTSIIWWLSYPALYLGTT